MSKYFVMLNCPRGDGISPMVDHEENVALFDDIDDARHAAQNSMMGSACGYEIFQREDGEVG